MKISSLLLFTIPFTVTSFQVGRLSAFSLTRHRSSSSIAVAFHTPFHRQQQHSNRLTFVSGGSRHNKQIRRLLMSSSSSSSSSQKCSLAIDPFCYRQFAEHENSAKYKGTVFSTSMEEFTTIVNDRFEESSLKAGYAPFCKHVFLRNDFTDACGNVLPITEQNGHLLRCRYEARNEKELPVLSRYFPSDLVDNGNLPKAKYLDLILYSREQIEKENASMGNSERSSGEMAPWGIVSIKAQDVDFELPMQPITAMRNALGKEEGGSGITLDREKYMEAYMYWKDHAVVS